MLCNFVSQYAYEHGKMSNKVALQDGTYDEIRARFHLPSQMACSVPRQVGATYKAFWTKVKQNAAHRKTGRTKKRYKGLGSSSQVRVSYPDLPAPQRLQLQDESNT